MNAKIAVFAVAVLVVAIAVQGQQPRAAIQPPRLSVSLGANPSFSELATGIQPLHFQWQLNGTDLAAQTSSRLMLSNVQSTDAGGYTVVVTNTSGSITSQVALLVVDTAFWKITSGPVVTDGGMSWSCAWGDYDGDGYLDLFVSNSDRAACPRIETAMLSRPDRLLKEARRGPPAQHPPCRHPESWAG